jgi:hypothetical protein
MGQLERRLLRRVRDVGCGLACKRRRIDLQFSISWIIGDCECTCPITPFIGTKRYLWRVVYFGGWYPLIARKIVRSANAFVLAVLLGAVASAVAAGKVDFSGSYTLKRKSAKPDEVEAWTLRVSQSESAIEVARNVNGHPFVNKFPLDGSEGKYVTPGGSTGTCKAQLKSKSLILDSFVTTHPLTNGPAVQMHTRERWDLSSDSKTLKIHTDVDFPNLSGTLNGFQVVEPSTEIYTRN